MNIRKQRSPGGDPKRDFLRSSCSDNKKKRGADRGSDFILLNIDSNSRLTTTLYDKRGDFDFAIVTFPFLYSKIPHLPAYVWCVYNPVDLIRKNMFYV
jgi:hypothetical protein